ncbi:hypothetical protein BS78_02G390400 [Paspalum vaginatum]|nr:hypothetical protein BS78_02G390400 [Paspalum vaginatum]KAJ1292426.1 hypothetical protein BS78_02G390400 [Paspalum vaginatum]
MATGGERKKPFGRRSKQEEGIQGFNKLTVVSGLSSQAMARLKRFSSQYPNPISRGEGWRRRKLRALEGPATRAEDALLAGSGGCAARQRRGRVPFAGRRVLRASHRSWGSRGCEPHARVGAPGLRASRHCRSVGPKKRPCVVQRRQSSLCTRDCLSLTSIWTRTRSRRGDWIGAVAELQIGLTFLSFQLSLSSCDG